MPSALAGGNRSRKRALPATQLDLVDEDGADVGVRDSGKPGRKSEPDMAAMDAADMPPPVRRRRSSGDDRPIRCCQSAWV